MSNYVVPGDIPAGPPPTDPGPGTVQPVQTQPSSFPTSGADDGVPAAVLAVVAVVVVALIALALVLLIRRQGGEQAAS